MRTKPMTGHSMAVVATNNAAGGGSKNHRSSLQHGGAYGRVLYSQNSGEPGDGKGNLFPIVFVSFTVVVVLLRLVCCRIQKEQEAGDGDRSEGQLPSRDPSTVAAVEVVPAAVRAAEPPLVCAFRKEDRWGDDSCGVCLAELADGEAVRVLPACMHFFHAACVNQWLRGHDTCPLCRAPLVATSPADDT